MAEEPIRKYQPVRRASIAPASSTAPEAPVMVAPGATTIESPVSQASREREARVRKQFEDIEARYGRDSDVSYRRAEMRMSEAPETPVTDVYTVQMRPRIPVAGTPLEPLVIAEEQRKREEWISEEAVRAATLPGELQYEIRLASYNRRMAEYDRQMSEYHQAVADAEYLASIREEKLIRHLNELGSTLTDIQLEAQRAAREGIPQAEYLTILESQRVEAERLQRYLQDSFGVSVPATEYIAEVESIMAAREMAPVTMHTTGTPAPGAPYYVTVRPDIKLTTDTVPPYREPVPSDPIEQIFYHHAPIVDKFRVDTTIDHPALDVATASVKLSRAARGVPPSPIAVPITEQLMREPTRPISAVIEMPGELALGVYRIPTVVIPHYKAHPEELPGLPGKIVSGMGEEFLTDPVGFSTKLGATAVISGPAIQAVKPVTVPIKQYAREITISLRRHRTPAGLSPGTVYGDAATFPDIKRVADVGGTTVYGDTVAFPDIRRVADVGKTTVYGDAATFPDIKRVADVGKVSVYGDTAMFPDIKRVADVGKVSVYGDTAMFPDIKLVAKVGKVSVYGDAATFPDIKRVADIGVKPEPGIRTLYTPEELGKRNRLIMTDRAAGDAPAPVRRVQVYKVDEPGIEPLGTVESGAPQVLVSPLGMKRPATPVSEPVTPSAVTAGRGTVPIAVVAGATATRVISNVRRDVGIASVVRVIPGITSIPDTGITPITISTPDITPTTRRDTSVVPDTVVVNIPVVDTITLPETDTITDMRIDTPIIQPPIIPIPQPPHIIPPGKPDDKERKRYPWEEWFISYRDAPTPHKGLEGAYLGLPDIARPGPVTIKNIQRITRGPAPAKIVTPKITRGKPVRLRIGTKRLL